MIRSALLFLVLLATAGPAWAATLSIVTASLPETRGNPFSYSGLPAGLVSQAVFEPLVKVAADGKTTPVLAESWVQETPLRWVFTLRQGVVFSNGEAFTSAAVMGAFNYALGTPLPVDALATQVMRDRIARVTAPAPFTIVIETKTPDPILPLHIIGLRIPAPEAWAKGLEAFLEAPVGSGPYQIDHWAANAVALSRNSLSRQPGKIDTIKITAIPDQTARMLALSSRTADIAMDIPSDNQAELNSRDIRLQARTSTMVMFVQLITEGDTPLKDVRVRRALNHAVNKNQIIEAFIAGAVQPATQFTHKDAFGFNPNLTPFPYDPDRARALLAEAGFKNGFAMPILYVGGNGADKSIYQQLASDLAKVGVTASLREITLTTWMQHLFSGEWPARAFVTGVQGFDPLPAFTTRSCHWAKPHYCDTAALPLLAAARSADTAPLMQERIMALMAHERENPPGILLWPKTSFDGLASHVTGYDATLDRLNFNDLALR